MFQEYDVETILPSCDLCGDAIQDGEKMYTINENESAADSVDISDSADVTLCESCYEKVTCSDCDCINSEAAEDEGLFDYINEDDVDLCECDE